MTKVSELLVVAFVVTPKQIAKNVSGRVRKVCRRDKHKKEAASTSTSTLTSVPVVTVTSPTTSPKLSSSHQSDKLWTPNNSSSVLGEPPIPGSGGISTTAAAAVVPHGEEEVIGSTSAVSAFTATSSSVEAVAATNPKFLLTPPPPAHAPGHSVSERTIGVTVATPTMGKTRTSLKNLEEGKFSSPRLGSMANSDQLPRHMSRTSYVDQALAESLKERREEIRNSSELPASTQ